MSAFKSTPYPGPVRPGWLWTLFIVIILAVTRPALGSHFTSISGNPGLRSESALIVDASGAVIYGKNPDAIRPIASITKLMTAMVIIDWELDLDEKLTVTREDRDLIQLTGSRLDYGASLSRRDMIMLAVMASENRAATVLGRTVPGGMTAFVERMNLKAAELGMNDSHFADPAGLSVENRSSASDLVRMVRAAYDYPLIRKASTTQRLEVRPYARRGPLVYGNTNRLLKNSKWDIAVSKTGYIMEAGRCLVMQAMIDGESVFIVLLNSYGKLTPFGDSNRLMNWMLDSS